MRAFRNLFNMIFPRFALYSIEPQIPEGFSFPQNEIEITILTDQEVKDIIEAQGNDVRIDSYSYLSDGNYIETRTYANEVIFQTRVTATGERSETQYFRVSDGSILTVDDPLVQMYLP